MFRTSTAKEFRASAERSSLERAPAPETSEEALRHRLSELQAHTSSYAAERGKLLAKSPPDKAALAQLDRKHADTLKPFSDLLSSNVELSARVDSLRQTVEDKSRSDELHRQVDRMESDAGFAHARGNQKTGIVRAETVLSKHGDLFSRNPQLRKELSEHAGRAYRAGQERWASAEAASEDLYNAMWGAGTDEAKIISVLSGKSAEDISAIETAYRRYYKVSLRSRLNQELSGTDLEAVNRLMEGDAAAGKSARLYRAMSGAGTDEAAIMEVLEAARKDGTYGQVKSHFDKNYAKRYGAKNLEAAITLELGANQEKLALAYLGGKDVEIAAAKLHIAISGLGTDEAAVYAVLSGVKEKDLGALKKAYGDGIDDSRLENDLREDLNGLQEERALALLDGRRVDADAAGLEYAMNGGILGLGTDEKLIRSILTDTSDAHRKKLEAVYTSSYGKKYGRDLAGELKSELGGDDLVLTQSLLEDGKLSAAEQVREAVAGAGTNETQLKAALAGKSKADIDSMRKEYREKFDGDLASEALGDVSGDGYYDVKDALKGTASTAEERLARMEDRYRHERSGIASSVIGVFSKQPSAVDMKMDRSREIFARAIAIEKQGRELSRDLQTTLAVREQIQGHAFDSLGEAKSQVTDTVTTSAVVVVATGVTIGTLGAGAPLWGAALAVGGASAMVRGGLKYALKGDGYGWEESSVDLATSSVEGASALLGGAAGKRMAEVALNRLATTMLVRSGQEITEESLKAASAALGKNLLVRLGVGSAEALADGTVSGAFEGAVGPGSLSNLGDLTPDAALKAYFANFASATVMGGASSTGLGAIARTSGEAIGSAARRVTPGVANAGAASAPPDAMRVGDDLLDVILNSPPVTDRNANLVLPGDEPALVGAVSGPRPGELSAAYDGPAYRGDIGDGRPPGIFQVGDGADFLDDVAEPAGDPAFDDIVLPERTGSTPTSSVSDADVVLDAMGDLQTGKISRASELAATRDRLTDTQFGMLPRDVQSRLEAAKLVADVRSKHATIIRQGSAPDVEARLIDAVSSLRRQGASLETLERALSSAGELSARVTVFAAEHFEALAKLQADGLSDISALLKPSLLNGRILRQLDADPEIRGWLVDGSITVAELKDDLTRKIRGGFYGSGMTDHDYNNLLLDYVEETLGMPKIVPGKIPYNSMAFKYWRSRTASNIPDTNFGFYFLNAAGRRQSIAIETDILLDAEARAAAHAPKPKPKPVETPSAVLPKPAASPTATNPATRPYDSFVDFGELVTKGPQNGLDVTTEKVRFIAPVITSADGSNPSVRVLTFSTSDHAVHKKAMERFSDAFEAANPDSAYDFSMQAAGYVNVQYATGADGTRRVVAIGLANVGAENKSVKFTFEEQAAALIPELLRSLGPVDDSVLITVSGTTNGYVETDVASYAADLRRRSR